jgi:hypothetical protein
MDKILSGELTFHFKPTVTNPKYDPNDPKSGPAPTPVADSVVGGKDISIYSDGFFNHPSGVDYQVIMLLHEIMHSAGTTDHGYWNPDHATLGTPQYGYKWRDWVAKNKLKGVNLSLKQCLENTDTYTWFIADGAKYLSTKYANEYHTGKSGLKFNR